MPAPRFGLSLPNRGVLFGATSVDELLALSETAEASGAFDSIWVGDSLFAKPRLESLVLLSAIAARMAASLRSRRRSPQSMVCAPRSFR